MADVDRLVGVPGFARILEPLVAPRDPKPLCPVCGWSARQVTETALLGCGFCYTVFEREVNDLLAKHGSSF